MKHVIFLDVDGVLNNQDYASYCRRTLGGNGFGLMTWKRMARKYDMEPTPLTKDNIRWDPRNVGVLKRILEMKSNEGNDVSIVVSSTWRKGSSVKEFNEMFRVYDLPQCVVSFTPEYYLVKQDADMHMRSLYGAGGPKERGIEIQRWLDAHPETKYYVILDDDMDMLTTQEQHYVRTNYFEGLTPKNIEEVRKAFLCKRET